MESIVKNSFVGLCIAASVLLISSSTLQAQVVTHTGDLSVGGGYASQNNINYPNGDNHPIFALSGGYNVMSMITVLGEYSYMPMGNVEGISFNTQTYGGGARFNMHTSRKVVPYGVIAIGGDEFTGSANGVSANANGFYVGFGGGASIYLGQNWGVRPEFRYERQEFSISGISTTSNVPLGTVSIFYQFHPWGETGVKAEKF